MGPEYVSTQINSHILQLLLGQFCQMIFTPSQMLICFSLIKHFSNNHKRYPGDLQVSMLYRVAFKKFYLTIMRALKTAI